MEAVLAVVRPKQNVSGHDYRAKLYDILLLDHKIVDKHGKLTKFMPTFSLSNVDSEPRDEVLTYLYDLTGGEHSGIKGERVLVVPWNEKEGYRKSLSQYAITFFCIPIGARNKLASSFVENSPNSPGFYSLEDLVHSVNTAAINFPPPTRTLVMALETWLKEKHSRTGALDILFRSRAEYRIHLSVSNPVFLSAGIPDSLGQLRNSIPDGLRHAANELLTQMMAVEKCDKVVINSLFGSGLTAPTKTVVPPPDYFIDSGSTSRKSSLNSSIVDPDRYSLEEHEFPLHVAVSKGNNQKIQELISAGNSPWKRDPYYWTPVHCAAWYGHSEGVRSLLDAGCSPNVVNSEDRTPLHLAALKGFPDVVEVLLQHHEMDVRALDKKGRTALEIAAEQGSSRHEQVAWIIRMATRKPPKIPVLVMDDTSKQLSLNAGSNTSVQQLNQQMLREYNMPETPYADIFTIWLCSKSLELQLKPEHKPLEHMGNWRKKIVNMLTDGNPDQEEPHLKWRRNAKISLIVEREVVHPDAIRLLFHEARHNYIKALYPCKDQDVLVFASILLYMNYLGSDQPLTKSFVSRHLPQLVPAPMLKTRTNWASRILNHYKEFSNSLRERDVGLRSPQALQNLFLNNCRNLTVYGSAFFTGNLQQSATKVVKCFIGVNDVGLHIINAESRGMLHSYKYSQISWSLPATEYGVLDVKILRTEGRLSARSRNVLKLQTKQAGMIDHLMRKLTQITYGILSARSALS